MLEQEKLDNLMIEMDGTDNKCKPLFHLWTAKRVKF